jgi:hypothetical protein
VNGTYGLRQVVIIGRGVGGRSVLEALRRGADRLDLTLVAAAEPFWAGPARTGFEN